ncbi:MAG TPA: hypothetical protein VNV42_14660 [Solirubrobacteraceae bacterium]|jgi:hypothetical protein|nr:hypothetical protein [Solirubrobacteraceae bacterium]
MPEPLQQLLDSLLYEGYALYPYTPGATKNATPTPFGIVYPPAYARALPSTFDHLELRCVLEAVPDAVLEAELRCLIATGARHQARAETLALPGAMVGALAGCAVEREVLLQTAEGLTLCVWLGLSARELQAGSGVKHPGVERPGVERRYQTLLRVENRTAVSSGLDRAAALRRSLLSSHPVMRVRGGHFISPLERPCGSTNTFPVLATARDDAVIGTTIVLPDHPQIAPESRGALFDSTEIEEALLLHVLALSDAEREEIGRQDPAVSAMVARAAASSPQDILALHGRVTLRDPRPRDAPRPLRDPLPGGQQPARDPYTTEPPQEPVGLHDPRAGEEAASVDGVVFRRGATVLIKPGREADLQARMLEGRSATIERILTDYDGKVHFGVTIDGDPGQDLMRDTGRYLYFFAPELELCGDGRR